MSWASRRQSKYLLGLLVFLGLIVLIFLWPTITRKPTCTDTKQNGTETGIDCGGVCQRICTASVSEPTILWYRAFPVTGHVYNLVAFVENQNKGAAIASINYEFRVYGTNNLLIGRREGSTFIPPNQQFAIFESRFDSGESEIKSISFEFTSPFVWVKKEPTLALLPISIDNVVYGDDKSKPTMTARVSNDSVYDLPAFDVISILYNVDHNAINASKTHKEGLASNANTPLLFTWPEPFPEDPVTQDVLIRINPFLTSF
jgi:hypothetical protein